MSRGLLSKDTLILSRTHAIGLHVALKQGSWTFGLVSPGVVTHEWLPVKLICGSDLQDASMRSPGLHLHCFECRCQGHPEYA